MTDASRSDLFRTVPERTFTKAVCWQQRANASHDLPLCERDAFASVHAPRLQRYSLEFDDRSVIMLANLAERRLREATPGEWPRERMAV